jgi:hypothetical protein
MKTHPLNVSYLVVGLAFLGIAGSWALHESGVIDSVDWLLPLTLVIAGGVGLVAFLAKGLRGDRTDASVAGTAYDESGADEPHDPPLSYDPTIEIQRELDKTEGEER